MLRFLTKIVNIMKEENLFASQGGPIILSQVENEYGNVEWAYGIGGKLYVNWAASAAVALNTTVPWVMCQQEDAPDPVINTCNGFYCDRFMPNSPLKPKMWTENYSGWFLSFGYAVPFRPVEDLAFSVARFFETGGTFQNYYMYFGGTNFGRTAGGPLVATSYDYDAPIDEYGFLRQPKWSHLRDLHIAIKLYESQLVNSDPIYMPLGVNLEAHIYNDSLGCVAFLANIDHNLDKNVSFNGKSYAIAAWSVSILSDCKNVIYNTAKIVSQETLEDPEHEAKVKVEDILAFPTWKWYKEKVGIWNGNTFMKSGLQEQINITRDSSDYLWYSINITMDGLLPIKKEAFIHIESLGHAGLLFVNKELAGIGYGNHDETNFTILKQISLHEGNNIVDILSMTVGLQNYGPWFDIAGAGIVSVSLVSVNGAEDLSSREWTYQIGTEGESIELDKLSQANNTVWISGDTLPINRSLIWYMTSFTVPDGSGPLALNLSSMGKGQSWINGRSIGRYWSAYLSPENGCSRHCDYRGPYDSNKCLKKCGQPAQKLYHVPRSWVHPGNNLIVLHEELGGDPSRITLSTRKGYHTCAHVSESDIPPVESWKTESNIPSVTPEIRLACDRGWKITSITFASFGTPQGQCGEFRHGTCSSDGVMQLIQEVCVGQGSCAVAVSIQKFGDPCKGVSKSLAVEALCSA